MQAGVIRMSAVSGSRLGGLTAGQASCGTGHTPRPSETQGVPPKGLGFCRLLFAGVGTSVAFERWTDAAFDYAIADADELEDRAGACIAEPGLGEAENAS